MSQHTSAFCIPMVSSNLMVDYSRMTNIIIDHSFMAKHHACSNTQKHIYIFAAVVTYLVHITKQ